MYPPITWNNIFNTTHHIHGHISKAKDAATQNGYPYFAWNGKIINSKTDKVVATHDEYFVINLIV